MPATRTPARVKPPRAAAAVEIITAPAPPAAAPAPGYAAAANLGLALLLLGIIAGWFSMAPPDPTIRLGYMLMALPTAALAVVSLARPAARCHDRRWWVFLICVLSIVYNLGYRFDPARGATMIYVFWGKVAVQLLANFSLLSLGQSYGMLPALRRVRTGLFYGVVRHPVYALYILADMGLVSLQPSLWNAGVAAFGATLFFLRATLEERVLRNDPAYADYMCRVRWRFFPGVH